MDEFDMTQTTSPEVGQSIQAGTVRTNYHDRGDGPPVVLIHGSGPGVSAWANWRLNLGPLAEQFRVIAPDMVGFGFTDRSAEVTYGRATWTAHLEAFLDALELDAVHLIGNSFGGAIALAFALERPQRVRRLVLMGSVGLSFPITPGLEAVWGYEPSIAAMRELLDLFAYDRSLVTDELAELRYQASVRPGFQASFASMFPAPRQRGVDDLASPEDAIAKLPHETLILHGREDRVIPPAVSQRLFELIPSSQLHLFGHCGHWTQIEHAARFNRMVTAFLAEDEV
jgi:2-hydroxymuconate-semialdehyde hydrolase